MPLQVPGSIARGAQSWTLENGRVVAIVAEPLALLEHGTAMFTDEPIRAIELEDPQDDAWDPDVIIPRLAAAPWLTRVESIAVRLYRTVGEDDILATLLAATPNLRELRVSHPSSAMSVAQLPLPSLAHVFVYCEGSPDGDKLVAALATRSLRSVQVVGCGVTDAAAHTIATARWPLSYLAFGGTHYKADALGTRGVMSLANAASLAGLATLDLVSTGIDDEAVRVLASSPHLRAVERLGLAENRGITDAGLAALAASPLASRLRELAVHETSVTPAGIAAFRARHPAVDVARHTFTMWGG